MCDPAARNPTGRPRAALALVIALALFCAAAARGGNERPTTELVADHGLSGTWGLEGLAGDRIVIEARNPHPGEPRWLFEGGLLVFWLTHGLEGEPRVLAGRGRASGAVVHVDEAWSLRGSPFGEGTHAEIERVPWGTLVLRFGTCEEGELEYSGPPDHGAGSVTLRRRVWIGGLECGVPIPESRNERVLFSGFDGHWRSRTTQDVIVMQRPDPVSGVVYWLAFDSHGRSTWRVGEAATGESSILVLEDVREIRGAPFGVPIAEEPLERVPWGRATFLPESCSTAGLAWSQRGSGRMDGVVLERRGAMAGTRCADAWPAADE